MYDTREVIYFLRASFFPSVKWGQCPRLLNTADLRIQLFVYVRCLDPDGQGHEVSLPALPIMRSSLECRLAGEEEKEGRRKKVNFHRARNTGWTHSAHSLHGSVQNRESCSLKNTPVGQQARPHSRCESGRSGLPPTCPFLCRSVPGVHTVRARRYVHSCPLRTTQGRLPRELLWL